MKWPGRSGCAHLVRIEAAQQKTGRMFFFEKKNQKTFAIWDAPDGDARTKRSEVFWFFFSKKNGFLLS
jgi:hypothetical protein